MTVAVPDALAAEIVAVLGRDSGCCTAAGRPVRRERIPMSMSRPGGWSTRRLPET